VHGAMSIFAVLPEVLFARCLSWCPADAKGLTRQTSAVMCLDARTSGQRLLAMTRLANEMRNQWLRERDMRRAHSELQFQLFIARQNAEEDRAHLMRTRTEAARVAALAEALNGDSESESEGEGSGESQEEEMHSHYHF
jgi:hypothetical protein